MKFAVCVSQVPDTTTKVKIGADGKSIDLLLIAKSGRPRLLRIDRRSGAWRAGEEVMSESELSHTQLLELA